ncbi:MAG: acyl-CoA dehydrogenase family protein [Ilumatobacteraceae bacterium]
MEFSLEDHHEDLRRTLRQFFSKEAPIEVIAELDRQETYPAEILDKVAALGLWGLAITDEYGGLNADEFSRCIVVEEMQRAGACLGYAFMPTALFCAPGIQRFGTDEQRRTLLPPTAEGKFRFAMALTEPDVGSDLTHLSTRATADGDSFVVRGQKIFITGADVADLIFTLVRTAPATDNSRGLSVLLIPAHDHAVTIRPLRKLAGQGTHTCEVFFDDVRVPAANLVGDLNGGARLIFELLDADRIYTAAQSLGIAQGALDLARQYAQQRIQFGKPIIEHQAIGHMLADMTIQVEMARLLTYKAAWLLQKQLPCSAEASMAKIAASEVASRCAQDGMQILGGYSYIVDYGMERYYREAKIQEIFAGTNQIQRNIVARHLQRLP